MIRAKYMFCFFISFFHMIAQEEDQKEKILNGREVFIDDFVNTSATDEFLGNTKIAISSLFLL